MSIEIRLKRGTASYLEQLNPVLAAGEPCLETDTLRVKYGDGAATWRHLPYSSSAQAESYVFSGATTTTTPLKLTGDKTITLAVDEFLHFSAVVTGQRLSKYSPTATWRINGSAVRRSNGAIVFVGTPSTTASGATAAVGAVSFLVDLTINGLSVRVISATNNPVNWTASVAVTKWPAAPYTDTDIAGCPDPDATNYDPNTDFDDGSCAYSFPPASPHLVPITTSNSISSLDVTVGSNSLYPAFDPAITDYCVKTSAAYDACANYSVTINGDAPITGQAVAGQTLQINDGTNFYYVRVLPTDVLVGVIDYSPQPDYVPGYYLTGAIGTSQNDYFAIYDHNGVPLWYAREATSRNTISLHLGSDLNRVVFHYNWQGGFGSGVTHTVGRINGASFSDRNVDLLQSEMVPSGNSSNWDNHEALELALPVERKNNIVALIHNNGFQIQEQSATAEIVWEWQSSDYFASIDPETFHVNALDVHPVTGNILVSSRHTSSVLCIEYSTKNVLWAIDGTGSLQGQAIAGTTANTKWLTIVNEPSGRNGTSLQHDARWHADITPLTPGGEVISVFDNGGSLARGVMYEIDAAAGTATHRSSIDNEQGSGSPFMGSYAVLADGAQPDTYSHAVYFCQAPLSRLDEYRGTVDGAKTKVFSMNIEGRALYRLRKVLPSHFRLDNLRATCGIKTDGTWVTTSSCGGGGGGGGCTGNGLLLHFDGANSSTNFVNEFNGGPVISAFNGGQISTAQSKFGGSSGYFANGGYAAPAAPNALFQFNTNDFTVAAWVYPLSATNDAFAAVVDTRNGGGQSGFILWQSADGYWTLYTAANGNADQRAVTGTTPVALNTWTHLAAVRQGSTLRLFINGVEDGTLDLSGMADLTGTNLLVGTGADAPGSVRLFNGYIDDLFIANGTALYTANFTPPTGPLNCDGSVNQACIADVLLHFDGADAQTTFTDSSTNNYTITQLGNGALSATQKKFGATSLYCDGNTSGVSVTGPADAFRTDINEFTVEAWIYPTALHSGEICLISNNPPSVPGLTVGVWVDGTFFVSNGAQAGPSFSGTNSTYEPNQWYHIALVRTNGELKLFVNGVQLTSDNPTYAPAGTGDAIYIGASTPNWGNFHFQGYIDEWRYARNAALYTANFTPPTAPICYTPPTVTSNTKVLLNFNGTNDSTTIIDSSANNFPVSVSGNAKLSTAEKKFGTASLVLDGNSGGSLVSLDAGAFAFGAEDFTLECWIYPTSSVDMTIAAQWPSAWFWATNALYLNNVNYILLNNNPAPLNTWTHVALTRAGDTVRYFVDGVVVGTATLPANFAVDASSAFIGVGGDALGNNKFVGHIDDFRITTGAALYTANFTPPTQELTAGPSGDVSLLLGFNGTNGSTTFTDSSANALTTASVSNATISTTQVKFGSGSGLFLGDPPSFIDYSASPLFGFGTGDFTIEMFVYNTGGSRSSIISIGNYTDGILWRLTAADSLYMAGNMFPWQAGGTGGPGGTVPQNTWAHIALTRQSNVIRVFVDGVKVFQQAGGAIDLGSARTLRVGCSSHETSALDAYYGYIDDLRITKGVALYTANFTPPTTSFVG